MKNCTLTKKIVIYSGLIFLIFSVMEGFFRYILINIGLGFAVYIPKLLITISVLLLIIENIINLFNVRALIFLILFFFFFIYIALFNIQNIYQILFGFWTFFPLIYGFLAFPVFLENFDKIKKIFLILWIVSILGIYINVFYAWPWIGFEYSIGSIYIEANRDWWAPGGFFRLSGFSRMSPVVASHIFIMALILYFIMKERIYKFVVWILSGIAILLTTTKTILGAWLLFSFLFLLEKFLPSIKELILFVVVLSIFLPSSTLFINYDFSLDNFLVWVLLASFKERLTYTWPYTFELINNYGLGILGRGIGGAGISQKYFEPYLHSPVDNLPLYLFSNFGVLGIIVFLLTGIVIMFKVNIVNSQEKLILYLYLYIVTQGVTTTVLEEPISAIIFGGITYLILFNSKTFPKKSVEK